MSIHGSIYFFKICFLLSCIVFSKNYKNIVVFEIIIQLCAVFQILSSSAPTLKRYLAVLAPTSPKRCLKFIILMYIKLTPNETLIKIKKIEIIAFPFLHHPLSLFLLGAKITKELLLYFSIERCLSFNKIPSGSLFVNLFC